MPTASSPRFAAVSVVVAAALATIAFTTTVPSVDHATLASAFPIAQAQFAH